MWRNIKDGLLDAFFAGMVVFIAAVYFAGFIYGCFKVAYESMKELCQPSK